MFQLTNDPFVSVPASDDTIEALRAAICCIDNDSTKEFLDNSADKPNERAAAVLKELRILYASLATARARERNQNA